MIDISLPLKLDNDVREATKRHNEALKALEKAKKDKQVAVSHLTKTFPVTPQGYVGVEHFSMLARRIKARPEHCETFFYNLISNVAAQRFSPLKYADAADGRGHYKFVSAWQNDILKPVIDTKSGLELNTRSNFGFPNVPDSLIPIRGTIQSNGPVSTTEGAAIISLVFRVGDFLDAAQQSTEGPYKSMFTPLIADAFRVSLVS